MSSDAAAPEGLMSNSLKTEEKTVTISDLCREEGPNPCDSRGRLLPAHQCTN